MIIEIDDNVIAEHPSILDIPLRNLIYARLTGRLCEVVFNIYDHKKEDMRDKIEDQK